MDKRTDFFLRPARPEDAPPAAEMLNQSMRWMGDDMFGSDRRRLVLETLAGTFRIPYGRFSYRYSYVADKAGQAVGLLVAYPGTFLTRLDIAMGRYLVTQFSPAALIRLVWRSLALAGPEAERGEYYISNLAVQPPFRGQGIGSQLLALAEQQARNADLHRTSLCVDMDNEGAFRLYQRAGYQVVLTQHFKPRAIPPASPGYRRMVKMLPPITS